MKFGGLDTVFFDGKDYVVTCLDPFDEGTTHSFTVTQDQALRIMAWSSGQDRRPIQTILPDLSVDQRELLLTGIPPSTWDELCPE